MTLVTPAVACVRPIRMTATTPLPESVGTSPVWRDLLPALLAGLAGYALSCLLQWPADTAVSFGATWQQMSSDPFALQGDFPHRILTSLLSWSFGCRGAPSFLWFVRGTVVVMLALVWLVARSRGAKPVDATLVVVAVALISPVQIYKIHWVGYVDPTTYALLLAAWLAASRPALVWGLFFAALLNHEATVFLLPWLWFVRRGEDARWRADVLGAGVVLVLYAGFYLLVRAASQQRYAVDYFASHPLFPGGTVAVWVLALAHWILAFGPILAVVAWFVHTREHGRERWHVGFVVAGMLGIFCIAFDWARHSNLLLLPLVLASARFLAAGHRLPYVLLIAAGAVGMWFVSPWPSKSWPTHLLVDPAFDPAVGVVIVSPTDIQFGPLRATLTRWLPAVLPTLGPILAIGAAIWLFGWWLARRDRAAP